MDNKSSYTIGITIYSIIVTILWLSAFEIKKIIGLSIGLSVTVLLLTISLVIYKTGFAAKSFIESITKNKEK